MNIDNMTDLITAGLAGQTFAAGQDIPEAGLTFAPEEIEVKDMGTVHVGLMDGRHFSLEAPSGKGADLQGSVKERLQSLFPASGPASGPDHKPEM